jgi:hypothetical protein
LHRSPDVYHLERVLTRAERRDLSHWGAAANSLSGVTVTRHVADPLGRFGTAITVVAASAIPQPSAHWARYRLIYDPGTSQILAWELIPRSAGSFETFAVSHLVRSDRP